MQTCRNTEINFLQINFLDETVGTFGVYDVIVSNPPYIPVNEKEKLPRNVTEFEPEVALFVSENDPFIFYKKMAKFAQHTFKRTEKFILKFMKIIPTKCSKYF